MSEKVTDLKKEINYPKVRFLNFSTTALYMYISVV
jgi:hypothetical protein